MKRYLIFMLVIMPIMLFTACSSESNEDSPTLNGTIWQSVENTAYGDVVRKLTFHEKTVDVSVKDFNGEKKIEEGTYKYEPPYIHITGMNYDTHKLETYTVKIVNNIFTLGEFTFKKI